MSIKLFCVLAGLVGTTSAALLGGASGQSPWVVGMVLVAVGLGLRWWARGEVLRGDAFLELSHSARSAIATTLSAAILAHTAWVMAFLLVEPALWSPTWWRFVAVPPGLAVLEWLVACGWDRRVTHVLPATPADNLPVVYEAEMAEPPLTIEQRFANALARINRGYIEVVDHERLDYGWAFSTHLPSHMAVLMAAAARDTSTPKASRAAEPRPLTRDDAGVLANAWSEETGMPMMEDWVIVTPERMAGKTTVTVIVEDVLALAHPYPLSSDPRGRLVRLGVRIDGQQILLNPDQHIVIVGKSGSGKSSMFNVLLAELTLPDEVTGLPGRVWIGGRKKIYDLIGQWLDVHLGTDNALPFDWVVQGQEDTLDMLVTAIEEAERRQSLPHAQRSGLDKIWVCIEEVPTFLRDTTTKVWFRGRWWVASELYAEARMTTKSAGIYLVDLAQQFTNAMYGDDASAIKANAGALILMQSTNGDERSEMFGKGGAAMGDLYNPGEFYLRDRGAPERGKGHYLQEMDARLERRHDGPDIEQVSMVRSALAARRDALPDVVAGEAYATRPQRMTQEFQDYLRGVSGMKELGAAPVRTELTAAEEVEQMVAEMDAGLDVRVEPARPTLVSVPAKATSLVDRIVDLVTAANEPLAAGQVLDALHAEGDQRGRGSVDNALLALKKSGRLVWEDGRYSVSSHVSSHV